MDNAAAGAFVVLVVVGFLILLAILWILLPFLVKGTNSRLDKIIRQNDRSIEALAGILAQNDLLLRYYTSTPAVEGSEHADTQPESPKVVLTSASPPGISDFASLLGRRNKDK